ncbi:MAG: penicillin acylase family protein [Actinomycetota bacterium]
MSDFAEQLRAMAAASLFPEEGELEAPGLSAPVEVLRDRWGVPYLTAGSQDDLWFAQGFLTAGERLFQLDLILRTANGRLSEVFADRTLDDDRFARTIGFHTAGARIAATWDERSRAMHERFRAGVFAWVEAMPAEPIEYTLLDLEPDLPRDEAAWAAAFVYLAWTLSGNWDTELLRAWIDERLGVEGVRTLLPPLPEDGPVLAAGAMHGRLLDAAPRAKGQGSNDWVVSGERTASGKPMLANDPHLLALQPSPWIELHLHAPGYEARGVALTFSPGVLLGATAHHAWGVTNVTGDVQDLYVERLNQDGTAAEFDGAWEPLTIRREEISVRGDAEPVVVDVRETRHGPILDSYVEGELPAVTKPLPPGPVYALRWTGHERAFPPSLALDAAAATDFASFRRAAAGLECPGQNMVYADVDGTIGYQCTGAYPVRRAGGHTAPVPGWTGANEWEGLVPFDELPWCEDPERGFVATANNRIHDAGYPHRIGDDFHTPYRARRITELLLATERHDVASFARIQADTVSLPTRTTLPFLELDPSTDGQRAALALLAEWDGDMAATSAAAAVFNAWCRHLARRILEPRLGDDLFRAYHAWREVFQCEVLPALLRDPPAGWFGEEEGEAPHAARDRLLLAALDDALVELADALGPDPSGWTWGALHRVRLAHPLAALPGLEPLFTAVDAPFGGDEQTVAQGGFDGRDGYAVAVIPSWRAVYDLDDLDRSMGVLPTGVSGNPASPHWSDQAELWLAGELHPLPFTRPAVEAAAVAALRLVPGYHP